MRPAHIRQAETMVQIGEMRQRPNQSVQSLIAALNELEEQREPDFTNDERRTNLFLALNEKLRNEIVRFEKPHATREELEESAISLEKTFNSTETSSRKGNSSGNARKPQTQRNDASSGQKRKSEDNKQADFEGAKRSDGSKKKPRLRCYSCDKSGHLAKECRAPKKRREDKKEFGKRRRPVSGTSWPLAPVEMETDGPTDPDTKSNTADGAPLPSSATPSDGEIDKLLGLDTIRASQLENPTAPVDVHRVIDDRVKQSSPYHHLFHEFTIHSNSTVFPARAMIDSGTTWNLVSQDVVKQRGLIGDDNLPHNRKALGNMNVPIRLYQRHDMVLEAKDRNGQPSLLAAVSVIGADFTGCDLIVGML